MTRAGGTRRPATLATLAASLKVSRTTISNAYNRPDQLSPALRQRVLREAARLGYPGPDPVARSLRTRRAGAVGLLLTEALTYAFRDPAAVGFLAGLSEACEAAGQGLLLVPAHPGRDAARASRAVLSAGVDGFVVYSVAAGDPYLDAVLARGVPVVICDQPTGVPDVDRVGIDDRGAQRQLADHLVELGHQRVGVLTLRLGRDRRDGPAAVSRWRRAEYHVQRERIAGVAEALVDAGLTPEDMPVIERFDNTVEAGSSAAAHVLDRDPSVTALICTTDVLALGALAEARRRGIGVPGQLTITGFDGVPAALADGITTVVQPVEEKGRAAGRLLFTAPEPHGAGPRTVLLPTTLKLGRTSGVPQPPRWFSGV